MHARSVFAGGYWRGVFTDSHLTAMQPVLAAVCTVVPSYFAGSCGAAPLAIIRQYVEQRRRPA